MRSLGVQLGAIAVTLLLGGCGGGSTPPIASTPVPTPTPSPTPTPATPVATPTPTATNFDTVEYRASSGPSFHDAIVAYEAGASGAGVLVGIVDTGIADPTGEFSGRLSTLSKDFAGNSSYIDVSGHGSAVAETLAGARNDQHVLGMAWGANILALRTDKPGSCAGAGCEHSDTAIAQAIDYAWRSGARIINLSLGGDVSSPDLLSAVSRATAAGTIIVVAAGNAKTGQAPTAAPDLLASTIANPTYSHGLVIVATSVASNGQVSSFSDGAQGFEQTTLSALGESVRTIDNHGTDLLYSGTSFSAPQISGAAALLAQAFPGLSSAQIVQLLLSTARDAGATGPDAVYGMGILDVARAFEPQGTLSLAGSGVTLSMNAPTLLSTAMGDASPAALAAVVLDSYRRPYRTDLSLGIERPGLRNRLTGALMGIGRQIDGTAGPLTLAFNIAPERGGMARVTALDLDAADQGRARFLSGTVSTRLSPNADLAFGLRTGLQALGPTLGGAPQPAFLIADNGGRMLASELRADSSVAWRQALGHGFALMSGIEAGTVDGIADPVGLPGSQPRSARARYQAVMSALSAERGRIGLSAGLRLIDEQGSTLGARFAPMLGAQSARSLFTTLDLHARALAGLTLAAAMQRGWTYAQAGGALGQAGLLRSRSWSVDLMRAGLLAHGDLIGLRVAAPLRVTSSRFALELPQAWDWQSGTTTMALLPLDLAPRGSERDYELSYGLGVSGGWLGANLFLRRAPGNIAALPDDEGAALRWSARF